MKVYKKGYQIVVVPPGATKKEYITSMHTRFEFSADNTRVYIRDVAFNSSYTSKGGGTTQETFSCLIGELQNEVGTPIGDIDAVENYLCDIIAGYDITETVPVITVT